MQTFCTVSGFRPWTVTELHLYLFIWHLNSSQFIVIELRETLFYELKLKAWKVRKKIDLIWISGLDPIHHFRSIAQPGRTVLIISIVVSESFFCICLKKNLGVRVQCVMSCIRVRFFEYKGCEAIAVKLNIAMGSYKFR